MRFPRSILITGASSGIGYALARAYAAPATTLALGGRDAARLDSVAAECRAHGAEVRAFLADVTDAAAMRRHVEETHHAAPLDLVVANAGISEISGPGGETEAQARHIYAVNVEGVMNTVFPAIDAMRARTARDGGVRGQIAIMASLAGFHGYPGAPAYVASKNAVRAWGESLRGELYGEGIRVSVICPGFVATPMTAGATFPQPFKISAERAAEIVKRGLLRDRARIAFPWPTYFAAWLGIALPERMVDPLIRRMPKKR
jgi:short-subunit dehydrogenase